MPYRIAVSSARLERNEWPQGSFLGNVFRAVTGVVGGAAMGFLSKGIPGAIGGAVGGAVAATKANIAADRASVPSVSLVSTAGPLAPPPMMNIGAPNAAGVVVQPGGVITSPGGTPVSAVGLAKLAGSSSRKGTHLNKTWSYSRRTGQLAPPGTKMVSNRTMNWANGRAVSRAERRIKSFVKHATRYIRWVHPKKDGHAAPNFKGKRK